MIRTGEYPQRMHWFELHMELIRQSLVQFSKSKQSVESFVDEQEREWSKGVDVILAIDGDRERDKIDELFVKAYGNNLRRQIQHHVEFAENKINQTEIILRCAYFEAEMKDIHRFCLYAKPEILQKRQKEIPLAKLIAKGEDAILEEEIETEVRRLDKENVKERAKYFKDTLGLDWGDPRLPKSKLRVPHAKCVEALHQASEIRNKIVHRESDYVVKLDELETARRFFTFVPSCCCKQAVKLYPTHFAEK